MKALTEWDGKPREMWVWDEGCEDRKKRALVVFYYPEAEKGYLRVLTVSKEKNADAYRSEWFKYCAELVQRRLMTNKELSRWLGEKPGRECKRQGASSNGYVFHYHSYLEMEADKEVDGDIYIREDDGKWFQPFVEEE